VRSKLKIVLTLAQLLSDMDFALDVTYPPVYGRIMHSVGRVTHVSLAHIFPLQCDVTYGFEQRLWVATLWPLAAIGAVWAVHLLALREAPADAAARSHGAPVAFSLAVLYVVFPSVSMMIFHSFACTSFDYGDGDKFREVLAVDYAVSCAGAAYGRIRVYAAVFACVYPAVPLLFFLLLFRIRRHLNPRPYDTADARVAGLTRFVEREVAAAADIPSRRILAKLEAALLLKQQQMRDAHGDIAPYQLLYREFEPEFWFWDILDAVRRLALSAAISVFARGQSIQTAVGFFVSFVYASAVSAHAPYVDAEDDWLARASTQIVVLVYFATHAHGADLSDDSDATRATYRRVLFAFGVVAPLCLIAVVVAGMVSEDEDVRELQAILDRERRGLDWVKQHVPARPRKSALLRFATSLGLGAPPPPPPADAPRRLGLEIDVGVRAGDDDDDDDDDDDAFLPDEIAPRGVDDDEPGGLFACAACGPGARA